MFLLHFSKSIDKSELRLKRSCSSMIDIFYFVTIGSKSVLARSVLLNSKPTGTRPTFEVVI